ncbi:MAG: hypothetical protein ACOYK8_00335 [Alphaproteobacteria bacterium]
MDLTFKIYTEALQALVYIARHTKEDSLRLRAWQIVIEEMNGINKNAVAKEKAEKEKTEQPQMLLLAPPEETDLQKWAARYLEGENEQK